MTADKSKIDNQKSKIPKDVALELLRTMLKIRRFDEWIIPTYPTDVMVTPVHLHIGQEAVPAGVCAHLTPADTIFFGHRTHGPALAKGMTIEKITAELYGRVTGCSGGFGGSMHLVDPAHGMLGSSAIVGGNIALGVGSGLAAKLAGEDRIAVSYFGDAATNAGAFWESLNFAALKEIPVLFVCENNNFSNTMAQSDHMYVDLMDVAGQFMRAWGADGTDAISVYDSASRAVEYIRTQCRPAFIECKTKRWMKHQGVDADDMADNPIDRAADCPIAKLEAHMFEYDMISRSEIDAIEDEIAAQIEAARQSAETSDFPVQEQLLQEV